MPNHSFLVNGKRVSVNVENDVRVLWVLRDILGVHGPKYGCGLEVCKACTSHLNGQPFNPCGLKVGELKHNDHIVTIEGLPATVGQALHPMQQAWLDHDVSQCGYCQPGQIMNAVSLVERLHAQGLHVNEEELDEIRNVCRCGTYPRIREAILQGERDMLKAGLLKRRSTKRTAAKHGPGHAHKRPAHIARAFE